MPFVVILQAQAFGTSSVVVPGSSYFGRIAMLGVSVIPLLVMLVW